MSKKIDIYNSTDNSWTEYSNSKIEGRVDLTTAVIGTKAIFFGGRSGEIFSKKIDVYDSIEDKWTISEASEARGYASVAVVGNKAIFFSGCNVEKLENKHDYRHFSSKIDIYDHIKNEWTTSETNVARDHASVAVIGTKAIFLEVV